MINTNTSSSNKVRKPNPQALAAIQERILWFLAKREMEKRAKKLKGKNRRSSIKV